MVPDGRWLAFVTEREASRSFPKKKPETKRRGERSKSADKKKTRRTKRKKNRFSATACGPANLAHLLTAAKPDCSPAIHRHWRFPLVKRFEANRFHHFHCRKQSRKIARKIQRLRSFDADYRQSQLWSVDVTAAEVNSLPVKGPQLTNDPKLNIRLQQSPGSHLIASATKTLARFQRREASYPLTSHDNQFTSPSRLTDRRRPASSRRQTTRFHWSRSAILLLRQQYIAVERGKVIAALKSPQMSATFRQFDGSISLIGRPMASTSP